MAHGPRLVGLIAPRVAGVSRTGRKPRIVMRTTTRAQQLRRSSGEGVQFHQAPRLRNCFLMSDTMRLSPRFTIRIQIACRGSAADSRVRGSRPGAGNQKSGHRVACDARNRARRGSRPERALLPHERCEKQGEEIRGVDRPPRWRAASSGARQQLAYSTTGRKTRCASLSNQAIPPRAGLPPRGQENLRKESA